MFDSTFYTCFATGAIFYTQPYILLTD